MPERNAKEIEFDRQLLVKLKDLRDFYRIEGMRDALYFEVVSKIGYLERRE